MKGNEAQNSLFFLGEALVFPPVEYAQDDGLLAAGGDLSVERLLLAYKSGIFPWFNTDALLLWWSPDPRMVLRPKDVKISKSMRKVLRDDRFKLTKNQSFEAVIEACSSIEREGQDGTWITDKMKRAYLQLYEKGYATSYEVWENDRLVGGLYGVDLGTVFCGESMFSKVSNASKFAFIKMAQELEAKNYRLIDCQIYTSHLESLGAQEIPRSEFIQILKAENKRGE
ncbi:leucyl/phenylalanyl-tRNA--protein transferase [Zobellia galactanivorans]|uniref:Leucyl/phenylalanyl-tRNA--protein transferase n=1 Tax=Zobellia galactanivorans (strain DSM 12802 / CCUG 47099 / CIP 106680 / NCIMB 13871 / Dsij) TaxID=63186 RepID=G0L3P7_ZOBGA|nr:leucyl/phenylalanyl-tRNA--protein transferase [Zobellia galactanivorans]CAZ95385.1 Leucyl/phenylalanyl-tRNA--protein transferase [Zobellia galactanivorans]